MLNRFDKPEGAGVAARSNPTLADVAAAAGVATGTASMALRDHERISPETRKRVKAAASELGYVGNVAARSLRAQTADAIAVVVPQTSAHVFGHLYFMHLLDGITEAANRRDVTLVLSTNADEEHGVAAYERVLRSGRVDGVIVASASISDPYVDRIAAESYPVVVVGGSHPGRIPSVAVDDHSAAEAALKHLWSHGCRTIAHITGPTDHQTGRDRLAGYQSHVPPEKQLVAAGDYDQESGARAMRELLKTGEAIDGVFAANDEMALGAMRVAADAGLRIPEDIRFVGVDDFGLAEVVTPSLTTVRVPARQMGSAAAGLLFATMNGDDLDSQVLDVSLVERASCGCDPQPDNQPSSNLNQGDAR